MGSEMVVEGNCGGDKGVREMVVMKRSKRGGK